MRAYLVALGTASLFVGAGTYVGCGSSSNNSNTGGSDSGTDVTTSSSGGSSSGGSSSGGSSSGASSSGGSSGAVGDGGADAPSDAPVMLADGIAPLDGTTVPSGDASALGCGSGNCNAQNQTCCVYPILNPPPSLVAGCSNGASCPPLATDAGYEAGAAAELHCEVQANCTGMTVCCLQAPSNGVVNAHCKSPGACVATALDAGADGGEAGAVGLPTALLCDPSLGGDAGCGDASACSSNNIGSWGLPSGFGTCGGVHR